MQLKFHIIISVFVVICSLNDSIQAQMDGMIKRGQKDRPLQTKPFENWTEADGLNYLDQMLTWGDDGPAVEAICTELPGFADFALSLQSIPMVEKILKIPEYAAFNEKYPQYAYDVTTAKIKALGKFKDYPGVREFIIASLGHESPRVQKSAAAILLSWGEEWDRASKIICEYEEYFEFQQFKDERAIPLLEDAVKHGSWKGRLYAAAALYYTYADSSWYPLVALDVILNAPINSDDQNINWAKFHALRQVPRFNLVTALPGLIRLAYDNGLGIGSMATGYLVYLSNEGYQEATDALIDIEKNHPDAHIREQAKKALNEEHDHD